MILAIDVGNTNVVVGCIENGDILSIDRLQTLPGATETEYVIKLRDIFDYHGMAPEAFQGAIIASVVPTVTDALTAAVKGITGLDCIVVGPDTKTDMPVLLDDPGTLAGDLIVGSVAAIACYGAPAIIMDLGTATTIVVIDKDGCYRGGAIIPGVKLSYGALASGTSLLPSISITPPGKVIATNTVDAMRSGAVFSTAAALDGMIDRMQDELGYACHLVATGGLASSITPYCRHEIVCDDDLLLKGLWALYQKNA
ncbi:MAG: type III pantothenate kinase [Oscillospiraceae bacterium]